MNENNKSKNNNTTTNTISNESEQEEINFEELLSQLQILNLSLDTLGVIILAILLNYYYIYFSKAQVLDTINNTKCAEDMFDGSNIPRIANIMIIYASGIFLEINYQQLVTLSSIQGEERDENAIVKAYRAFISSLLVVIAAILSRANVEV